MSGEPEMSEAQYKVYENRLRRMAQRQGLRLYKSRRRDPRAYDYGRYLIGGDRIPSPTGNYWMPLDEVEQRLTD